MFEGCGVKVKVAARPKLHWGHQDVECSERLETNGEDKSRDQLANPSYSAGKWLLKRFVCVCVRVCVCVCACVCVCECVFTLLYMYWERCDYCLCVASGSLALARGGICTIFDLSCASKPLRQSLIRGRCVTSCLWCQHTVFTHFLFDIRNMIEWKKHVLQNCESWARKLFFAVNINEKLRDIHQLNYLLFWLLLNLN